MFYSVTCFQGDTELEVFSQQTILQGRHTRTHTCVHTHTKVFLISVYSTVGR